MIAFTESTIAMTVAAIGVIGTVVWYAFAWYGIRTLKEMLEAVTHGSPNNE